MLEQRIGAVPVVDGDGDGDGDGNVAGIISYIDILRAVAGGLQSPSARPARHAASVHGPRT